ncbi:MAG: 2-enoyl thioester reductase domain-containing protein [Verrucomicrobia bacterium]|nr:2-enoyl thioester reductase domain-containing protein [Verrucomicrobiota bacterium]
MAPLALKYSQTGNPLEVLSLEEVTLPSLQPRQVHLKMLAAAIHPSDFGMIQGSYGKLRELPAIGGREGLAEVVAIGNEVGEVRIGDRVRIPEQSGAWQTELVTDAAGLYVIPADIPLESAATPWVNPATAWRLLRDAHVAPGSWVVQNAANSAVGVAVIQMAKHLGIKTLNVVRRAELIPELERLGADVVVLEDSGYEKRVKELTQGGTVALALNSIGGESAMRLIKCLSDGSSHVTFGAATFEPVRYPTRYLIFNDIHLRGFWMDRWYRQSSRERIQIMMDNLFDLMRKGVIKPVVAEKFTLNQWREAIEAVSKPRLGKVLFVGGDAS